MSMEAAWRGLLTARASIASRCFARDGKKLVFASTRNGEEPREFNIFIADWVP